MFDSKGTAIVPKEPGRSSSHWDVLCLEEYADLLAAEQAANINNATAVAEERRTVLDSAARLLALIEKLELPGPDGRPRPVIKVDVPGSLFVHQSPGGYFYRVGSAKRRMA